ncbi:MAG: translocation/assembly module TamB [Cytophagaceae bacterium]|nr:translocation/assembly module TamB [Cytophagaceae bacterium]
MTNKKNKALRILVKTIIGLLVAVVMLFVIVWAVLKIPAVQNFLVDKVTSYVSKKTHTRVELAYIDLEFPKSIVLQGIFLDDKNKDTLLSVAEIKVDISMLALLNHTVSVQQLSLNNAYGRLSRTVNDSTFNFQFLIDAFSTGNKKNKKPTVTDTTTTDWTIKADNVSLRNCRFHMDDSYSGMFLHSAVKEADIELNKLDLAAQSVSAGDVRVLGSTTTIEQTKLSTDTTTSEGQGWDKVSAESVSIEQSVFSYEDPLSCMSIFAKVGSFNLGPSTLSLITQTIVASGLKLDNSISSIQLERDASTPELTAVEVVATPAKYWDISLDEAELDNNTFKLDFTNVAVIAHGVDWNHLYVKGIGAEINKALYNGPVMKATIEKLVAQDRSGLGIRALKTIFSMDPHQIELKDLFLQTNYSTIGQQVHLQFASLNQLANTLQINCNMVDNHLAVEDLLLLQPDLRQQDIISKNAKEIIHFTLKAKGNTESLALRQLTIAAATRTMVSVSGTVKHVTAPQRLFMDLKIGKIQSGKKDIITLVPDSLLPVAIEIPDSILITGNYKGTLSDFKTQLDAKTSFGEVSVDALMNNLQNDFLQYNIALKTTDFQLGNLLKQTSVGKLSGSFTANGGGKQLEGIRAKVEADVSKVELNKYAYRNITMKGSLDTGVINMKGAVRDSNLHAELICKVNLNKAQESYDIKLNLKGMDFGALGLTNDHIQMSANGEILFKGNSSKNLNGHLAIRDILLIKNTKEYRIDSLVFASLNEEDHSEAILNSSMIAASFKGNIDLLSIVPAIEKQIDRYFDFIPGVEKEETQPQQFSFELQVNDSPVLREVIFPDLTSYETIHVLGGFNSDSAHLWLNVDLPQLVYKELSVQQFKFEINSDIKNLNYKTGWELFKSGDIAIQQTVLSGNIANDKVSIDLTIKDAEQMEKLVLHSQLARYNDLYYRFRILKDGLTLQGNAWEVNVKNYIEFGKKHLYVNQMHWSFQTQSISAQSDSMHLGIRFKEFNLHTIAQVAEQDDSLVQGILNGDIKLKDLYHKPAFTSDLKLTNLAYKQSKIGNLDLQADNLTEDRYSMKAILTGMKNRVSISGYYAAKETNTLNFSVDIDSLRLASIESFSAGQISDSRGVVSGNIKLTGSLKEPVMNGKVEFINVGTKITYLNEYVTIDDETLMLKPGGAYFKSFDLKDSQGNLATINGAVLLKSFSDPTFDLKITTNDFMVLNTTEINNKFYYGRIYLDSKINVKGTPQLPVITADLKIEKGSHFSFAVPESQVSTDRGEGIVVFIKDSTYFDQIMLRQQGIAGADKIRGISLKAKVSVDRNTSFTLLVDPYSGDSLQVKGKADLVFSLDPSGDMGLSGSYVISDGSYKATLEGFVAKEFKIIKGSRIDWYGDVLDAKVNVTARYDTRAKPTSLMSIGSGLTPTEAAAYSQPLPFYIYLMMKGDLLQPQISFKLDMPESQKGAGGGAVYGKLNTINSDEAELNKQVFSLLVFNSFMASSNASAGSDASDFARSSVSRLMSDQLNKLSAQYIKGVEVDVDLVSYNQNDVATNQKQGNTQLQVGVKKTLFDDRLSVQVGGNVMLEGQQNTTGPTTTNSAQNITGDVVVEYKFTKSGRYKLKGFRLNQMDGVTNGIIVQTGVGVVYTRDYNRTRDLFQKPKKKKKKQNPDEVEQRPDVLED